MTSIRGASHIAALFIVWFCSLATNAANFYCNQLKGSKLYLLPSELQSTVIQPTIFRKETVKSEEKIFADIRRGDATLDLCTWSISNSDLKTQRHYVLLQGVPSKHFKSEDRDNVQLTAQIVSNMSAQQSSCLPNESVITLDMAMLIVLPPGSHLAVTLRLKDPQHVTANLSKLVGAAALRVDLVVSDGSCTRDIPNYQGRCHIITNQPMTLDEQMEFLGRMNCEAAAQLAAFSSHRQILEFLKANNIRQKPLLNLSQPVMIGLFNNGTVAGDFAFLERNDAAQCALLPANFSDAEISTSTNQARASCVSLRVDSQSGLPVLELVSCHSRMPALISFPVLQKPRIGNVTNSTGCGTAILPFWSTRRAGDVTDNLSLRSSSNGAESMQPWYKSPAIIIVWVTGLLTCCCS